MPALLLFAGLPGLVVAQAAFTAGSDSSQAGSVSRPRLGELQKIIGTSRSVISKETRNELAQQLANLDKAHLGFASKEGIRIIELDGARRFVEERELALPRLTPLAERAATYSIFLQIDILDMVLSERNPELAAQMRDERTKVRLLKPEQRVFGDARDGVVAEIVRGLSNINKLHIALGVKSDLDISYPSHVKNLAQVEKYILDKTVAVIDNANKLGSEKTAMLDATDED